MIFIYLLLSLPRLILFSSLGKHKVSGILYKVQNFLQQRQVHQIAFENFILCSSVWFGCFYPLSRQREVVIHREVACCQKSVQNRTALYVPWYSANGPDRSPSIPFQCLQQQSVEENAQEKNNTENTEDNSFLSTGFSNSQ